MLKLLKEHIEIVIIILTFALLMLAGYIIATPDEFSYQIPSCSYIFYIFLIGILTPLIALFAKKINIFWALLMFVCIISVLLFGVVNSHLYSIGILSDLAKLYAVRITMGYIIFFGISIYLCI